MDEDHLLAAVGHVALDPVRARVVAGAEAWPWSSVHAHLKGKDEALVEVAPVLARVDRFADLIRSKTDDPAFGAIRAAETTGRPLGNTDLVTDLEPILGRPIAKRAPGQKPKTILSEQQALL